MRLIDKDDLIRKFREECAGECAVCVYVIGRCEECRLINDAPEVMRKNAEIEIGGSGASWWYVCEECHGRVDDMDHFCRHCGMKFNNVK